MTNNQRKTELYNAGNTVAAGIVLADVDHYAGEESLMVRWARRVVANSSTSTSATTTWTSTDRRTV